MTEQEAEKIRKLTHSRTEPLHKVQRARIVWLSKEGWRVPKIAEEVHLCGRTVRRWIERFNREGLAGFEDEPRSGRPPTYTQEQVGEVIQAALTEPQTLSQSMQLDPPLPFGAWTLDRLAAYFKEYRGIPISRDRIAVLLRREGLKWRMQERWFSEQLEWQGRRVRQTHSSLKKGVIIELYTNPPSDAVVVCLDEMGPLSAKSYPGARVLAAEPMCRRAKQEIDYGLRGSGYVFGAFKPHDGEVFTRTYKGRSTANMVDFLHGVDGWLSECFGAGFREEKRVFAILDNLQAHRSQDMMLFPAAHPHWHFIFQPTYAAYLNLIEPWWKVLRSLALKGKRFETWQQVCAAIYAASSYWNAHRHPFFWGRRRRHRRCSHANKNP